MRPTGRVLICYWMVLQLILLQILQGAILLMVAGSRKVRAKITPNALFIANRVFLDI